MSDTLTDDLLEDLREHVSKKWTRMVGWRNLEVLLNIADENAKMKSDLEEAAGELLLPIPEPGTDIAKMMAANSIMRQENQRLRTALVDTETDRDEWKRASQLWMEDAKGQTFGPTLTGVEQERDDALAQIVTLRTLLVESAGRNTVYCVVSGEDMYDENDEGIFSTEEKAQAFEREYVQQDGARPCRIEAVPLDARTEVTVPRWEILIRRSTGEIIGKNMCYLLLKPGSSDRMVHAEGSCYWPNSVLGVSTVSEQDAIDLAMAAR